MNSDEWIPIPDMPRKRFNAGCCKFGDGYAYVFGGTEEEGLGDKQDNNHNIIDMYSTSSFEWTTLNVTLASPVAFPICMQIGTCEILIMGGRETNGICSKKVHLLNVRSGKLIEQEELALP